MSSKQRPMLTKNIVWLSKKQISLEWNGTQERTYSPFYPPPLPLLNGGPDQGSPWGLGGRQDVVSVLETQALHPELEEGRVLFLCTDHLHQFLCVLWGTPPSSLRELESYFHFTERKRKKDSISSIFSFFSKMLNYSIKVNIYRMFTFYLFPFISKRAIKCEINLK